VRPSYLKRRELMRAVFIFSTYAVLGGPRFLFPSLLYFPLYAYAHKSVSEVISKLPNGASLAFERYFFIAAAPSSCLEWMMTIP
jgi:hypothetical protein